ncbi:MAG: hypothetical protein A3G49_03030 [Candidatus Sungbacteria bacterium RIFCSPLOWO2_12_FULL_41_11]|uniref:Uncharacterized protein n=1 Tax=Candidatus Sungbacteria bacterium RIFCSPLOWO2_12_FULL_41_11 TaxID=1802286 RepID=A0A1G2LTL6_9BACT|nr:MAG: DEAD/DEAH box helicase domain protein [Parcubacteria group bacterium GW2011_GWA2_42_14]OGZ98856.1 MAG: hypothetical protein A3D41_02350 [Candidatus Sungbacteria bacterium RIFCSPHIGHO2_02_FULL_41_12b]OHA14189.1 MAG: hypothetical protein A3G49_03030 [Candidatus Sungbacteria bacterium RIFCSPLOWO2_12_FULL_41_11]
MKEIVFDVETKKSFDEVGGRNNVSALGVSVVGAYFYETAKFQAYEEREIPQFEEAIENAELLIGFNTKSFDYQVLQPYFKNVNIALLPTLDIFEDVTTKLGHRLSLQSLAGATLGAKKSADGLQALQWFKEGRIDDIKKYCLKDVELTRDLYEYGKKHGHLLFESLYEKQKRAVAVNWQKMPELSLFNTIENAFKNRQRLFIEYVSRQASKGEDFKKKRKIDIYGINGKEISAYCHLRQGLRKFKMEGILAAEPINEFYKAPQDLQASLF